MNSTNNTPLIMVSLIAIVCIAAVVVLSIFAPNSNNVVVIIGFAATIGGQIIQGMSTSAKVKDVSEKLADVHQIINSRLTELVASTASASKAEGRAEGIQAEQDKQAAMP